jgi:predicted HicB family RNase H-like nuclease
LEGNVKKKKEAMIALRVEKEFKEELVEEAKQKGQSLSEFLRYYMEEIKKGR